MGCQAWLKMGANEGDDQVIGKAFRVSAIVLLSLAVLIALLMAVYNAPTPTKPRTDAQVSTPRTVDSVQSREPPLVEFTDVSEQAGIEFTHVNGAYGERFLPETMGSGIAFIDYDNDNDQDLILVNSTYWPWHPRAESEDSTNKVYRNRGNGTFENVTKGSGLDVEQFGMGLAVGDYDGDGFDDVFVTAVGKNRLFRNDSGKRFIEVTQVAGVSGTADDWSTGAAFFDFDRDGDLDLFVCNYVTWSRELDLQVDYRIAGIGRAYGPPTDYGGTNSVLYRNDGDGRFSDVTKTAGIEVNQRGTGSPIGKALAVLPFDFDDDGWLDLIVANDTVANFAFRNLRNGQFEEVGIVAGVAFDNNGAATGAMGIDGMTYNNADGVAVAIGNFANEMTSLFVKQSEDPFSDEAVARGIGPATRQALTFGLFFFDYDLDGRLDLLQANGHLEQEINTVQASQQYRQPAQLFWNCGADCPRQYISVPKDMVGDLASPKVGRSSAYADIDGDGDLDVVITESGGRATLFRNEQQLGHHWIRVKLIAAGKNTSAIGATLELTAGNVRQYRQVMPTRGYLSQVEMPVTFGLGDGTAMEKLVIRWPDGEVEEIRGLAIDRLHVLRQGETNQ